MTTILIGIVAVIASIIGYYVITQVNASDIAKLNPIDMTQSFTNNIEDALSSDPKEPIRTYPYCYSYIRGDFQDDKYDYMDTECFDRAFSILGTEPRGKKLEDFKFTVPAAMDDIVFLRKPTVVYQYGNNDFEIGLQDEVSEKRYEVKLWELPT